MATNVKVRFFDGPPWQGNQIGLEQNIASIPGGGGTGTAQVTWPAPRALGLHNIYVQVDPNRVIPFIHEGNKTAFRPFWQLTDYSNYTETFEVEPEHWIRDQVMPLLTSGENTRMAGAAPSLLQNDRLGNLTTTLHFGMDGGSDDGSVFIKRRIPINPGIARTINLSFWIMYPNSGMPNNNVAMFIGDYEPEVQDDFYLNGVPDQGWHEFTYQQIIPAVSQASEIWVGLGIKIN